MVALQRNDIQIREKGANKFGSGIPQVFEKNSKIHRSKIPCNNWKYFKFHFKCWDWKFRLQKIDFKIDGFYIKNIMFLKDNGSQQGKKGK